MRFPIDVVFVDRDWHVLRVRARPAAPADRLAAATPAAAIEVRAGEADRLRAGLSLQTSARKRKRAPRARGPRSRSARASARTSSQRSAAIRSFTGSRPSAAPASIADAVGAEHRGVGAGGHADQVAEGRPTPARARGRAARCARVGRRAWRSRRTRARARCARDRAARTRAARACAPPPPASACAAALLGALEQAAPGVVGARGAEGVQHQALHVGPQRGALVGGQEARASGVAEREPAAGAGARRAPRPPPRASRRCARRAAGRSARAGSATPPSRARRPGGR